MILQHARERFHAVGTAPLARLGLRHCRVEVVHGDADRRMVHHTDLPPRTALLYPHAKAVDLATLGVDERPEHLLVLDGTWPQSRRLYDHNPWLTELPHVRFTPLRPSGYRVRRPPKLEYLSTIESIVSALETLEPETAGLAELLIAFARMNDRQAAFMDAAVGTARRQRPRLRASRKRPPELFAQRLLIVYGELSPTGAGPGSGGRHEVLQWVAAHVDAERYFQGIGRPRSRLPLPRRVEHLGIAAEEFAAGESFVAMRARFRGFLGDHPVLAAWNQRTLQIARHHFGFEGPTVLLKAVHANLRGGRAGHLDRIVAAEGLVPLAMPFAGRAAERMGQAVAIARWLRAGSGSLADSAAPPALELPP